ncbi:type I DNA topoisomerase [Salisaeta longa]|uniref:type I DNA topoisomerase n=1 Tax=Salisaeta longa TaxID=503170 RepID=UPI0003B35DA8|nr:type I DNA topoisomerase [Salisaeta longa]
MKRLVVVESPTKAKTIRNFLPRRGYKIEASMGHIRDLPASAKEIPKAYKDKDWARLGVKVDNGFEPLYVVSGRSKKVVQKLRKELKDADELYIATDEDREGESIGWHLMEVLNPSIPVRRMVFHEITEEAIQRALEETRDIDQHLVEAQETRRILDRLVGYTISPLLWRKIKPRLSAGRVQSVAVRILVLRERERITFVPATYWDLKAQLAKDDLAFEADMTHIGGVRLAAGKDFDRDTGRLKDDIKEGTDVLLLSDADARAWAERLQHEPWRVADRQERTRTKSPAAPFITSTLQQEANRKLGWSSRRTMSVAQKLYENGYITYMRTDATNLSEEAVQGARTAVAKRYGDDYLSDSVRTYQSADSAQEAHEAIRPAGGAMKTKEELDLRGGEAVLYDLIWKRTVATQMADAQIRYINVYFDAGAGEDTARFRASGKSIDFPGFLRAYVEGSDDPEADLADRERALPDLSVGDTAQTGGDGAAPAFRINDIEPLGHETQPPARYTEASLVKTLEEEGIGRPSTYASIIDTIQRRGYVQKAGKALAPTFTAFATNNLMERQFEQLVDVHFTAEMEDVLDQIARGAQAPTPFLRRFYQGEDGVEPRVEEGLDSIDGKEISEIQFPKQWGDYVVRVGKYGPYVEGPLETGETATASLPDDLLPGDTTQETLQEILEEANKGDQVLGIHPEHDQPVILKSGPYGPYVQLGDDEQSGKPKRVSLPPNVEPNEVTFEVGLQIIDLPRELGTHPESGDPIDASIGRYGPYVRHKRSGKKPTYASLKDHDNVLTVELERALELIEKKEAKNRPQRVLGSHPESGKDVELWNGRYGPYVKHNGTNASLKDGQTIDELTMDEAIELLNERNS